MDERSLKVLEFDKIRRRLADHAAFSGGRALAMRLQPSTELEEVRARQALTAEARDFAARRGQPEMGAAHDLRHEIEAAVRGRVLMPAELLELRDTVAVGRRLHRATARDDARWPGLARLCRRLEPCPALYDAIQAALGDDGEVRDDASPALRKVRNGIRIAQDRLRRQLESIIAGEGIRSQLQDALITQRNGRFVIPVKSEFRSKVPGVVHDTSDSGATVFVEPLNTVESGNKLRELQIEEEREVDRILRELSGFVAAEAEALEETVEALGELDLVFAMAKLGFEMRAVTPHLLDLERPLVDFPRARHPLIPPDEVVKVDMRVGEDFRLLVITGPNTGGKTVTLKTTGLLVLMAQAGLQLPADEDARLGIFDAVFADIGDEQSIEQSLSTFSGHMTHIIDILDRATERSLVLLDELGAGTDPVEGAALAGALLDHFRERGIATVASTHYSELKTFAHATEGVANASVEFDVETLRPTYELTIGLPGRSNALAIAKRLGLPEEIVSDARSGLDLSDVAMEDLLREIRETRNRMNEDREAATEARERAESWAARLEKGVRELEKERADLLDESRRQAHAELEATREAIRQLRRRAEKAERSGAASMGQREALREVSDRLETLEEIVETTTPEPERYVAPESRELEPGDQVRVENFGQAGEVLRRGEDEVEVQVGILRMSVPLSQVTLVSRAASRESEPAPAPKLDRGDKTPDAAQVEIDLRGMRVEDGLDALDRHLNDALLSGLPWVRIIHGHGTGAMKTAVRDALRGFRHVKKSRPGERGEGGDGATIAYFE